MHIDLNQHRTGVALKLGNLLVGEHDALNGVGDAHQQATRHNVL